jgi:hypothetical protein
VLFILRIVGTYRDADDNLQYDGDPATAECCAKSIDHRTGNNEWVVKRFRPAGIFLFQPIYAQMPPPGSVERKIDLPTAIAPFSNLRIFSAQNGRFVEHDREKNEWFPVEYDSIITD